jgi:hypothetical protein
MRRTFQAATGRDIGGRVLLRVAPLAVVAAAGVVQLRRGLPAAHVHVRGGPVLSAGLRGLRASRQGHVLRVGPPAHLPRERRSWGGGATRQGHHNSFQNGGNSQAR